MEKKTIWHTPGMPEPDRWIYEKPSKKHPRGCCYYHHAMEPFTTDAEYAYIDDLISIIKALDVAIDALDEVVDAYTCQSYTHEVASNKMYDVAMFARKSISEIIGGK